ncbi:unnamed protein product [Sphenostylis stenocarpa]|uniref:RRM domain-containing protein n=1 Tax=Sphenostylis stenocarpa TaxID=92480 RepID=A0AA86VVN8_9FABA|nr:unnamed protein product [Sphenostylis stenocarpa]
MAVAENVGAKIGSSNQSLDSGIVSAEASEVEKTRSDQNLDNGHQERVPSSMTVPNGNYSYKTQMHANGMNKDAYGMNGVMSGENGGESFKRDMRDLEELLSKLNPMAKEFVPPSLTNTHGFLAGPNAGFGYTNNFMLPNNFGNTNGQTNNRRRKNGYNPGKRRVNHKMDMEKREEMIRRTVYVSDIDQLVTEEQLAALFLNCGQVVDCRVCGDPNSILRFAFIEFTDEDGARAALSLSGTMLGYYPLRVLPSKTAIAPVNPTFLPRSEDEREMCSRTIYCTNIDKKLTQADVKHFFESICGEVQRLRLLGDYHHSTRIAFVEFALPWVETVNMSLINRFDEDLVSSQSSHAISNSPQPPGLQFDGAILKLAVDSAESAIAALSCSGVILGSLPIRVSPSKTPVRPRAPRSSVH